MAVPPEASHTPFRIAEKHFKNRAVKGRLPTLRGHSIVDLSRPTQEEDDAVWQAGWWAPEQTHRFKSRKGKERERGERPAQDLNGFKKLTLSDGREAWVVAEGSSLFLLVHLCIQTDGKGRLSAHPPVSRRTPPARAPRSSPGKIHPPSEPTLPQHALSSPCQPLRALRVVLPTAHRTTLHRATPFRRRRIKVERDEADDRDRASRGLGLRRDPLPKQDLAGRRAERQARREDGGAAHAGAQVGEPRLGVPGPSSLLFFPAVWEKTADRR